MPWDTVYLKRGAGEEIRRMAVGVDVTPDALIVHWGKRLRSSIPMERINWVSEEDDPYESPFYKPYFVTVHFDDADGHPATITIACWEPPYDLVAAIMRARDEKLARSGGPHTVRH